jgi:hypothetical protein
LFVIAEISLVYGEHREIEGKNYEWNTHHKKQLDMGLKTKHPYQQKGDQRTKNNNGEIRKQSG